MKYANLFLKNSAVKALIEDVKNSTISHAYVLYGADEMSLQVVSHIFYSAINCTDKQNAPCFVCVSCKKTEFSADIARFPSDDNRRVLVSDAADIVRAAYLKPIENPYRIISIARADTMTEEAQNKILKTLEEPSSEVVMVLLAKNDAALLPTIRSRSRMVLVEPLESEVMSEAICAEYGFNKERADLISALSFGDLSLLDTLAKDEKRIFLFDEALNALLNIKSSQDIIKYASYFTKSDFPQLLNYLETIFRDIILVDKGLANNVALKPKLDKITELASSFDGAAAFSVLEYIKNVRERQRVNCSNAPLVDGLLFYISEVKFLCKRL